MTRRGGKLRRAGGRWRILAHEILPGRFTGDSHHVTSDRRFGGGDGQDTSVELDGRTYWSRHIELPGTELDELVVGSWIHLEQMDTGTWWANVCGVALWVKSDRDGKPVSISVHGPGDEQPAEPGCVYHLNWSEPDEWTAALDGEQ